MITKSENRKIRRLPIGTHGQAAGLAETRAIDSRSGRTFRESITAVLGRASADAQKRDCAENEARPSPG
jgi:hypothetical protein